MIPGIMAKISDGIYEVRKLLKEIPPMEVLELIQNLWSRYSPNPAGSCISGVDSGYNYLEMRGYVVYLVDAVYISSCGGGDGNARVGVIHSERDPEVYLPFLSTLLEIEMIERARISSKLVIVDGSLISKLGFLLRRAPGSLDEGDSEEAIRAAKRLLELSLDEGSMVIYLSKNSVSRDLMHIFFPRSYKSLRSDFYYFDRYTYEPGYSRPVLVGYDSDSPGAGSLIKLSRRMLGIGSLYIALSYIRTKAGGPIMRLEIPLKAPLDSDAMVRMAIDSISGDVRGYPLVLREADRLVRISSRDMDRIKRLLGLGSEDQAWEAAKIL